MPGPTSTRPPLLATALPTFAVALVFAWPLAFPGSHVPFYDPRRLARMLEIEQLVVYGGMFLVFPMMMPAHGKPGCVTRWGFFLVIVWGMSILAKGIDGWAGILSCWILIYATYASTMVAGADFERNSRMTFEAIGRWLIALVAFILVYTLGDLGYFRNTDRVLRGGALYFTALGCVDVLFARLLPVSAPRPSSR